MRRFAGHTGERRISPPSPRPSHPLLSSSPTLSLRHTVPFRPSSPSVEALPPSPCDSPHLLQETLPTLPWLLPSPCVGDSPTLLLVTLFTLCGRLSPPSPCDCPHTLWENLPTLFVPVSPRGIYCACVTNRPVNECWNTASALVASSSLVWSGCQVWCSCSCGGLASIGQLEVTVYVLRNMWVILWQGKRNNTLMTLFHADPNEEVNPLMTFHTWCSGCMLEMRCIPILQIPNINGGWLIRNGNSLRMGRLKVQVLGKW